MTNRCVCLFRAHPLQPPGCISSRGKHRFEFRYTGLNFAAPEKVRFKYRLDGLESDWWDVGTRRVAYYSYLKPGNYTFRVMACNNDGLWNEDRPMLAFTVLPRFWQTWWFTWGAVLAAPAWWWWRRGTSPAGDLTKKSKFGTATRLGK